MNIETLENAVCTTSDLSGLKPSNMTLVRLADNARIAIQGELSAKKFLEICQKLIGDEDIYILEVSDRWQLVISVAGIFPMRKGNSCFRITDEVEAVGTEASKKMTQEHTIVSV